MNKTAVILLENYAGIEKGNAIECRNEEDAQHLINLGIARPVGDRVPDDAYHLTEAAMTQKVYEQVKAQMKSGKEPGLKLFNSTGNFTDKGWGPMSPDEFYKSGGVNDTAFTGCGDFCKAVKGASDGNWDERLKAHSTKDLTEGSDEGGGFLVPEQMANFIWQLAMESNPFLTQSVLIPMQTNKVSVPAIADLDHSTSGIHGVGSAKGGPPHVVEAGALADISPSFAEVNFKLKKIGGRCRVSNEMMEDSGLAMSTLLPNIFADALNWRMYYEMVSGSGAGECLGVVNAPGTVSVAKESAQGAATIVTENIVNMFARMAPAGARNAFWLCNLDTLPQLLTMTVNVGTGGSYVWLVGGDRDAALSNAAPLTILGRPIYFSEFPSTVGTVGDIMFINPKAYGIGRKLNSGIRIDVSEHARFENDQTVFRAIARLDAQPLQSAPLTPHSGSANTLSNFVKLATR